MNNHIKHRLFQGFFTIVLLVLTVWVGAAEIERSGHATESTLQPGSSFSWMPAGRYFYDAARFKDSTIRARLEDTIIYELKDKGYDFVASASDVEFQIGYMVVLENTLNDSELQSLYEQEPELQAIELDLKSYEHGTLFIKAVDPKTRRHFWKNTLQGFVNLEMPDDVREQRLRVTIQKVLKSFPKGK